MFIILPDKSKKEIADGSTALEACRAIAISLSKEAICAKVNGELFDLNERIPDGCTFEVITAKSPEAIIGRSQVIDAKSKALQLSEVEKDVNAMLKNPEIAKEYNKIFDLSLDVLTKQGDKEAYEKSTLIADAYCKEFHQAG